MSESSPKLLDLISKEKEKRVNEERRYGSGTNNEDNKLELRLGLPGGGGGDTNWGTAKHALKSSRERNDSSSSLLSLRYYSSPKPNNNNGTTGGVIGCAKEQGYNPWTSPSSSSCLLSQQKQQQQTQHESRSLGSTYGQQQYKNCTQQTKGVVSVMGKDSSQPCCTRLPDLQTADQNNNNNNNNNAFSSPSAKTAVPNTSQKRAAPAPVVGWPPIRSFRKNLATSSSGKGVAEPQSTIPSKPVNEKPATNETVRKGLFVKINMDGVPIGRKVDLSAYSSYDSLSTAVDELFRGLLAAQRDSSAVGAMDNEHEEQKPITGLLDGSGEYTLVYEDNEGDRMLVGDVPWHMFASTVKRLRVLKSSDLASLSRGGNKEGKAMVEIASK